MKTTTKKAIRTTWFSIFGNILLAAIKAVVGYFGNSYALIADAIESSSDVVASILVLLGLKYSSMPPDENHPYGHGKVEPLMTFVVVGFLIASAAVIAVQSIQHIIVPHETPEAYTLYFLAGIILVKEMLFRFVSKKGEETDSTSLKADAWHHRSDGITSLMVFIGISIALIMGDGWEDADDWAALLGVIFILYNAFLIFKPALSEVMDEHLYLDMENEIRLIAKDVQGVMDTEKCFIRKTGLSYYVDLHIEVNGDISVKEGHDIAHHLKDVIIEKIPKISDVLIHVEPSKMV